MANEGRWNGNEGPGLPWASLLDPVANARALGDVQAQSLRAAGELVERLVRSVDGERRSTGSPETGDDPAADTAAPGDAARLVEVWIDLLRRTADSFGRLTDRSARGPARPGAVEIDVVSGVASGGVRIVVDPAGAGADGTAEVWLHNGTAQAVGPLVLHCGDVRSAEGETLGGTVAFDPRELSELPARSSRGIVLSITPVPELRSGTFRGLVQVSGAPGVWLPLEVVVEGAHP